MQHAQFGRGSLRRLRVLQTCNQLFELSFDFGYSVAKARKQPINTALRYPRSWGRPSCAALSSKNQGRAQHPRGCSACLAGPHGTSGEEYIHKVCLGHRILLVIGAPYPMQSVKRSKIELVRCSNVPSGSEYTSASPRLCTARENPEREIRHPRHNVTQQTPNS